MAAVSDERSEDGDQANASETEAVGLTEIRDRVRSDASRLIGHPFDALVAVQRRDESSGDWRVVVEVVERKAVPDTQDILGRYEVELDDSGEFVAYRRVNRLHRGDTNETRT